jgi:hypothetical protein
VTAVPIVAVNRPQNIVSENSVGSNEVATPVMEGVHVPGSRIVTCSALHLHGISASEARSWGGVDAPVSTEHGCAFMWGFDDPWNGTNSRLL